MLRKIRVYGQLAKFLGQRVFEADVASAAEAVRFLLANFPQLEKHMADQYYRVSVGKYDLALEELHTPAGQQTIRIIPAVAGAGGSGASKILLGVAIIGLSVLTAFAGASLALAGQLSGTLLQLVAGATQAGLYIGAGLALTGVAQLLTPTPVINQPGTAKDNNDPRKSYSFSGVQQTSRQGVPVPIVYGETLVGSVVISAGIDTVQVSG